MSPKDAGILSIFFIWKPKAAPNEKADICEEDVLFKETAIIEKTCLYMAAVAASRYNDVLRPIYQELLQKEESRSHCDSPAADMLCQCVDCWKIC